MRPRICEEDRTIAGTTDSKETDLYLPVKRFLESQGYDVKGEITNCDVVAVRPDEEPILVELKTTLSLNVLLQAVSRLRVSSKVYIGVPRKCPPLRTKRKHILKLLRMLGMGLIRIKPGAKRGGVDVLLDPGEYRPRVSKRHRERLLLEFELRVGDPTPGGTDRRRGIMTSYRQKAIRIACFLSDAGPTKASEVAGKTGEDKARTIMYRNVYGWFDRQGNGVYSLSPCGGRELPMWSEEENSDSTHASRRS